jgi:hypothetical protein
VGTRPTRAPYDPRWPTRRIFGIPAAAAVHLLVTRVVRPRIDIG